jgi:hypothetical protein
MIVEFQPRSLLAMPYGQKSRSQTELLGKVMWKPRLSFRWNRTSASGAVFILEDCMAEEIQKEQDIKWDLGLPYFRRAVRNGDEGAHAKRCMMQSKMRCKD